MRRMNRILSFVILCLGALLFLNSCFGGTGSTVSYAAKEEEKANFNNLSENGWFELYKVVDTTLDENEKAALKDKKLSDLTAAQKAAFEQFKNDHAFWLDIKEETYEEEGKTPVVRKVYVVKKLVIGQEEEEAIDKDGNKVTIVKDVVKGGDPITAKYVIDGKEVERPMIYVEMSDLGLKFLDDPEESGKKTLATEQKQEDKGFLYYILMPVGKMLSFFNGIVPSYLFTLFIFAVIVKILLFWFAYKQQKSMVKQAYFKPKERAIRNKYKGRTDQATMQKVQQEVMEAQRAEGVSAFGGCLPMLIQLPVIMILYQVVINPLRYVASYSSVLVDSLKKLFCYNSIEGLSLTEKTAGILRSASAGSLTELNLVPMLRDNWNVFSSLPGMAEKSASDLPNFYAFGNHIDLSVTPSITDFSWPMPLYLLIPIITFVALFLTMRLNRKLTGAATAPVDGAPNVGAANKIMDLVMPAMSTVFTFMFPALLGIYWIFNNLLGTVQQLILNKILPFPVFTEEDYKRAEREYNKGKDPKRKPVSASVSDPDRPKTAGKSLHHIDDEDDEDYPDLPPIDEDREPVVEKKGRFGKSSMKKDDRPEMKDESDANDGGSGDDGNKQ